MAFYKKNLTFMYNCGTLEIYNVLYLIGVLLSIFCLKLEFKCKDLFQITI